MYRAVLALLILTAPALATAQGNRAGDWEWSFAGIYQNSSSENGSGGSSLSVDSDWGLGIGLNYNFNNKFALGVDLDGHALGRRQHHDAHDAGVEGVLKDDPRDVCARAPHGHDIADRCPVEHHAKDQKAADDDFQPWQGDCKNIDKYIGKQMIIIHDTGK